MNEIWRSIKNYEGLYEVSNWGRVRSLGKWVNSKNGSKRFIKGRVLRPGKNRKGYLQVILCKDGVMKSYRVHRLVAQAFLPNPYGLPEINHKDKCKANNRVENLEWCDHPYNAKYSADDWSKKVYIYTLDDKLCGLWPSTKECGRNGFNQSGVSACCRGEQTKHRGFKWSYDPPKPPKALPYYVGVLPCGPSGQGD